MTKELNDFITKFNSMMDQPTLSEYQQLLTFISAESNLSTSIYKVLGCLQTKLLKYPSDIDSNYDLFKLYLCDTLSIKDKSLFDFIMNWLINLYYKLEDGEKLVLNLFFENLVKNSFSKVDLNKKMNVEDNYFFKMVMKTDPNCLDTLQRICYIQDFFEKKSGGSGDKSAHVQVMNKNKRVLEMLVKYYGRCVMDFYLILMCHKVKSSPCKFDVDNEKWSLKSSSKYYSDLLNYYLEVLFYAFSNTIPANARKLILFVEMIFLKELGLVFLGQLFQHFNKKLHNSDDIFQILKILDFSILSENFTSTHQNIDTTIGYSKTVENLLFDMIGTHNLKFDDKKQNEDKILNKLTTLKNFILLIESFINQILIHNITNVNIVSIYTFYYSLQLKFIKHFVIFPDNHKRRIFENQVNIGNITKIISKYNKQYEEINSIFSEIISLFYNKNGTSLIFQNWLIFLYKNGTILDAYKAVRIFLLTRKEGGQIYTLLKMHYEISKFYPCLWRIVLDSFLIDSSNRNSDENYNLITNLKFIFYYEISLKSDIKSMTVRSDFYDSLTYDSTIILKFFREKFPILTSIFFSDENLLDNFLTSTNNTSNGTDKLDMDICFETYIKQTKKTLSTGSKSKFSNKPPLSDSGSMIIDSTEDKAHYKSKIEILNILSFLLTTYNDSDIINFDINKFILDLMDVYVERRENQLILDHISNIIKILLKMYKKRSKVASSPIRILFLNLIKHILNKILLTESTDNTVNQQKSAYFSVFQEIYVYLNKDTEDVANMIIFMVKELVYKNVDNQSFKNPYTLKNMQGLNDIDHKITDKEFLIDLLSLLEEKDHSTFFGFYLRFLKFSIGKVKINPKPSENLKKLLNLLIKIKWLPGYYLKLIQTLDYIDDYRSSEKILVHILNYPTQLADTHNNVSDGMLVDGGAGIISDPLNKKKSILKTQFKHLLFENIKYIN